VAQMTVNSIWDGGRKTRAVLWAAKQQPAAYIMGSDPIRSISQPVSGIRGIAASVPIASHSL
jgi:hypothetical protein